MASVNRELAQIDEHPWGAVYKGKLTPAMQHDICEYIANTDMTIGRVCKAAGISKETYHRWLRYGRERRSGVFVDFVNAVGRARAVFEHRHLSSIASAALDTKTETTTQTKIRCDPDTGEEITETVITEKTILPDPKWSKYLLSIRDPRTYAERLVTENTTRMELSGSPLKVEFAFLETGALEGARAPALGSVVDSEPDTPVGEPEGS